MSHARGLRLQNALAAYLQTWWPAAESAGSGRQGRDVLHTPGVWFENKAEATTVMCKRRGGPASYVDQAVNGTMLDAANELGKGAHVPEWDISLCDIPVVIWWPPGIGAERPERTISMVPTPILMHLLELAEYTPHNEDVIV